VRRVEVIVSVLCDWPHEAETPAVVEHTITMDRGKPRVVGACEEHVAVLKELGEVLHKADLAEQVKDAPPTHEGKVACALCGAMNKPGQGEAMHARRTHGMSTQEYRRAIGRGGDS
jgi:hypothetical protein